MRTLGQLLVFPAIGLALIAAGVTWSGRELRLRTGGEGVPGQIAGMLLERADGVDLLSAWHTTLSLRLANGEHMRAEWRNYQPVGGQWVDGCGETPLSGADLAGATPSGKLTPELTRIVQDAVRGGGDQLRRALQREARRLEDPRRVVRLERVETVRGVLGLSERPRELVEREGLIAPAGIPGGTVGEWRVRAVFDAEDAERVRERKGELLVEYSAARDGIEFAPRKRDFPLFGEPYQTVFRPVFRYEIGGRPFAAMSHIGRHGGPTLALELFGPCRVYFDPAHPADATLMAEPGPIRDGDALGWFSRFCEGFFGQWGSGSLMVIAGCVFLATGAIAATLVIWPGKNQPPTTARRKAGGVPR